MTERLTLAIETSNPANAADGACAPGVALGVVKVGPQGVSAGAGWDARWASEPLREPERHDDDLMSAIDRLCAHEGVEPRDLERIAVSVGPGGYTAVRTAVAAAKMIAEATGASCIAVPSALACALCLAARGELAANAPAVVTLAGKGRSTWVTVLDEGWTARAARGDLPQGRLVFEDEPDRVFVGGSGVIVADRFLPRRVAERAASLGWRRVEPVFDARAVLRASAGLAGLDAMQLLPMYPREPDAVTQWRARERARGDQGTDPGARG